MYNCLVCNVIIYVHVCTLMKSEFSDAKYKSMHVCVMYAALPNLIIAHLAANVIVFDSFFILLFEAFKMQCARITYINALALLYVCIKSHIFLCRIYQA